MSPRGRPHRAARIDLPGSYAPEQRTRLIAWLLRTNRLLGTQPEHRHLRSFAAAFTGGCWPRRVDASTVSRWETGALPAPYLAIRRYEELLCLPRNQLVSVVDTVHRYWADDSRPTSRLRRPDSAAPSLGDLDQLLDRAFSTGMMTGPAWDDLTLGLVLADRTFLPRRLWSQLADRLLAETIIARNLAWFQRFEAFNRLLRHPASGPAAIDSCASLAADRTNLVFIETICALDGTAHPDANRHVLEQLLTPTNDRAFFGALLACVRKLRHNHFRPADRTTIGRLLVDLLDDETQSGAARTLAAQLLRQVPPGRSPPVLRRRRGSAGPVSTVLSVGRLQADDTALAVSRKVAHAGMTGLGADVPEFDDGVLPALVNDMLFDPVSDVRLCTAALIQVTPYRAPVAAAIAAEIRQQRSAGRRDELTLAQLDSLRTLGGPREIPLLRRLAGDTSAAPALRSAAAFAIGHVGNLGGDDPFWVESVRRHSLAWQQRHSAIDFAILTGLVYGLGIARNERLLRKLRDDPASPAPVRTATSWWLNLPTPVYASAGS